MRPRVPCSFRGQPARGLWAQGRRLCHAFCAHATPSLRPVAHQPGCSQRRGPRRHQAMARREGSPASWGWETAAGPGWLRRLGVAPRSRVGLQRGVGAASRRAWGCRRRLASPGGCAPSACRGVRDVVAHAMLATPAAGAPEGLAPGATRPLLGAVDDPCLARRRLGCLDLGSGALGGEAGAAARRSDPWPPRGQARLEPRGGRGFAVVRDRATARLPRAATGLACLRLPEGLPLLHARVQRAARARSRRLRPAPQAWQPAHERRATGQASPPDRPARQRAPALGETRDAAGKRGPRGPRASRHPRATRALPRPPWRLWASTRPRAPEGARPRPAASAARDRWRHTPGFPRQPPAVAHVRTPRAGGSALGDGWWQRGWPAGPPPVALTPAGRPWLAAVRRPRRSGQAPRSRPRGPRRHAPR